MSNQENALQVLNQRITKIESEITQDKIEIADVIINIHNPKRNTRPDVGEMFNELDRVAKCVTNVIDNQRILDTLESAKNDIEKSGLNFETAQ